MKTKRRYSSHLKSRAKFRSAVMPLRSKFERAGLVFLLVLSLSLIIMSKNEASVLKSSKVIVGDAFSPVISALSTPAQFLSNAKDGVVGWVNAIGQNKQLMADNEQLLRWQNIAMRLEAENKKLRELLAISSVPQMSYVTARIVGSGSNVIGNRYYHLNKGRASGIDEKMPIVTAQGLVGRVLEAGQHSSKVIAITDINSRIPVIGENSQERGILAGNNSYLMDMIYLPKKHNMQVGERVVTTLGGGVIPEGIVVGEVVDIKNNQPIIQPYFDEHKLDFVRAAKLAQK